MRSERMLIAAVVLFWIVFLAIKPAAGALAHVTKRLAWQHGADGGVPATEQERDATISNGGGDDE